MLSSLIDEAVELASRARGGRALLGLAGAPAAGKSTLARRLAHGVEERLGPGTTARVPMDGFHLSNALLDELGLRDRKGAPETFDVWGYLHLLRRVREERDRPVYVPDFSRAVEEPVAACLVVPPSARLVVTEGNYLADDDEGWREIRGLLDALWYVEVPRGVREARLLRRHERGGRTREEALAFIAASERPNAARVARGRGNCSRIIRR